MNTNTHLIPAFDVAIATGFNNDVNQRAKMTRNPGKSACKFDHPGMRLPHML